MSRESSPAFQFYPQDFLCDDKVVAMSPEARGVYIMLLCHCWLAGSIPEELEQIRRLSYWEPHHCRTPNSKQFAKIWQEVRGCFIKKEGPVRALVQPRIEREREKQANFRAMKVAAGQAGGKQKASNRLAEAVAKASSSSSSSSSSVISNNQLISKRKAVPAAQIPKSDKRGEDRNVRIITKIAHEILRQNGRKADSNAVEAVKTQCAKLHITYDSQTVRKALDSAEAQSA